MATDAASKTGPKVTIEPMDFRPSREGEPVYELAEKLFPRQGQWTPNAYFLLQIERGVELVDGCLEFLPMPSEVHQAIMIFFLDMLRQLLGSQGKVMVAGLRVNTRDNNFREPDVLALLDKDSPKRANKAWSGADIAIEIVSEGGEERDYEKKRIEYAAAGIAEYWIVDPQKKQILVLSLDGEQYQEVGTFTDQQDAAGVLIDGLSVKPADVWAAAEI